MTNNFTRAKLIRARYAGICAGCTEETNEGDSIWWYGSGEVYHVDCRPEGADPKPNAQGNSNARENHTVKN